MGGGAGLVLGLLHRWPFQLDPFGWAEGVFEGGGLDCFGAGGVAGGAQLVAQGGGEVGGLVWVKVEPVDEDRPHGHSSPVSKCCDSSNGGRSCSEPFLQIVLFASVPVLSCIRFPRDE